MVTSHTTLRLNQINKSLSQSTQYSVSGWVTNYRPQKKIIFIELRDGTESDLFQIVLKSPLDLEKAKEEICEETAITCLGTISPNKDAKSGFEMACSSYEVVGASSTAFNTLKNHSTSFSATHLLKIRPLLLRDNTARLIFSLRSSIGLIMRNYLESLHFKAVDVPSIVMNQVEGGSTLFHVDYFGEKAYLTQSSQLYLESLVPVVGNCYSMMTNYRAEKSNTRRHLSEYTHLETEMAFVDFEGLLGFLSEFFMGVTRRVLDAVGAGVERLNPGFAGRFAAIERGYAERGLRRVTHAEAIAFCNENGIPNDRGEAFAEGEDITEAPEREMVERMGEPVLLTNFPVEQKPFYMKRCEGGTESVDMLLPGVGEVVGGSMREPSYAELAGRFDAEGLSKESYGWYLDLRKYGFGGTGGFGMGVDRYLCWVLGQDNIRKVVLYPRYNKVCKP